MQCNDVHGQGEAGSIAGDTLQEVKSARDAAGGLQKEAEAARENAIRDLEEVTAELSRKNIEKNVALDANMVLTEERDAVVSVNRILTAERDAARRDLRVAVASLKTMTRAGDRAVPKLKTVSTERDKALATVETLSAERDAAVEQVGPIQTQVQSLAGELEQAKEGRQSVEAEYVRAYRTLVDTRRILTGLVDGQTAVVDAMNVVRDSSRTGSKE